MSGTDPRGAAGAQNDFVAPPNAGLLKVALVMATLLQVLDMTIANVALPHMQASLGANQDTISWVLTSYIIAAAVAMPATGWLSDRIGQRRLYLLSVTSFVIASVLCGIATSITEIVFFRMLQGVSGAFLSPLGQTVLLNITPVQKRGQAMSLFGVGIMIGPILGPVIGGWLTENMNWRWVFFVNVPFGALALAGLWLFLPRTEQRRRPFDLFGFAALAIGLSAFQLMMDRGQHKDWLSSTEIWIELFVAVSALWIFVVHLFTARNTLFPKEIIKDRNLMLGVSMMTVVGFVMVAAMALLPIMLEGLFGYVVMDAGLLLASRGIGVALAMAIVGWLGHRFDDRILLALGFSIIAFSFWEMSRWTFGVSATTMALNGFVQGVGMGMTWIPITTISFGTIDQKYRTDGASLINLSRSIGSSIGISLVVTLLARNSTSAHAGLVEYVTPYRFWFDTLPIQAAGEAGSAALAMLDAEVIRQAAMIAFLNDFYLMAWLTLLLLPLVLFVKTAKGPSSRISVTDLSH